MSVLQLSFLFGTFYFVQGISEVTAGLLSQPIQSLLKNWQYDAAFIGGFIATVGWPWVFKPVYGLLTDFVPVFGSRRRRYLLFWSAVAASAMGILAFLPLDRSSTSLMLMLLVPASLGIAFCDVVIDALMVETGQPRGLTGRLQSVQWSCIFAATILAKLLGGWLSEIKEQQLGFLICSGACAVAFITAAFMVRERPQPIETGALRAATIHLFQTVRSPVVLVVGGFLMLWQFNPFLSTAQYNYMTKELKFSETFNGTMEAWYAVGALIGTVLYGFYCRRIPRTALVHVSILMGVLMTLAYWGVRDQTSAIVVSICSGFAYGTANVIMLDLAAQAAPPMAAGTTFALLMAASNLGINLAQRTGGSLYELLAADKRGYTFSYNVLVAIGAATTACCWLLVPLMKRAQASVNRPTEPVS